jgi:tetratricopeptide (TPR) repeat protein
MVTKRTTQLFLLLVFCFTIGKSQITVPPSGGNQKSVVTQYIGSLATVSVIYNSPDVTAPNGQDRKGKIWGQLVPYGMAPNGFGSAKEIPWRAGANENTIIKLSHDVTIQGKALKAGKYGVHIIPKAEGAWTLIFNKNTSAWGSYYYDAADDALRVEVTPEESGYTEWLTYDFVDRQPTSCVLALKWENLAIPFKIELSDAKQLYVDNIRDELKSSTGFQYQSWVSAVNYCVANDVNLEEALVWADKAISAPFIGQENFATLSAKAAVLNKLNRGDEAIKVMNKAVRHATATSFQIHGFGRQLITLGQKEKALEVFQLNAERFGEAWPTNVGLARGYSAVGQYDKALKHAKLAHAQAPDKLNKDSLSQMMEQLKANKDVN